MRVNIAYEIIILCELRMKEEMMMTLAVKDIKLMFHGWNHLQHTRIAVEFARWHFLLFLSLKTIKNSNRQIRRLYAYAANDSTHI